MAVTAVGTGVALKLSINMGLGDDGKQKRKAMSFSYLNGSVTDEQVVAGAHAMDGILKGVVENIYKVGTTQLIES